ncbi:MAG TPA: cytochrome P450 [Acidimicrobiales bacterium]|nr:cytochrome P450 [Acidimicrobiales bacterium]
MDKPNVLDPEVYAAGPFDMYRLLRDEAPCYWDPTNGIWALSRYRDVMDAERSTKRYSSAHGSRPLIDMSESMINRDDPRHLHQRKLVSARFTPAAVRRHEDHVRAVVNELIDAIAPKGEAEVVEALAAPLPAMVICELLGFDRDHWPMCKHVSEVTMAAAGYRDDDARRPDGSVDAVMDFAVAFSQLMEARRAAPGDDLCSAWVTAELEGAPMPDSEIVQDGLLLLDGGAETTRSTIGQIVLALCEHEDQRRRLIDDPGLLQSSAIEEFIRWASPILNMRRTVTEDHELHGQSVHAGDQVLLMYGAANRDERYFRDPDTFDVGRTDNRHLAFGFATHFCLGANLARLEIRVLFEELLRRLPDFRMVPGTEPEFVPGYFTRTLRDLHIEFTPER